jgi:RNA polymerase sigma-70 factor (ECF subfamily)
MDAESFKRQFLPYHPRLYRIAYALTGNSQDAEDILQDTYCKLWNKREELGHINNTEAFCITLVKNLCFDLLRSPGKNRQEEGLENLPHSTGISPETEAIGQDESRQIQRLIDKLPEKQRQVIRLRAIDDCSLEEIEEITGLSAVNVRVLLSRARKIVKEQYIKVANYER